jgi:hypothetical protein
VGTGSGKWPKRIRLHQYPFTSQLAARDTAALAISLRDPVPRNPLIKVVFTAYSPHQPKALTTFAPLLRPEDKAKPLSVPQVVQAWRRKNEAGAAAWVESLPESGLKCRNRKNGRPPSLDSAAAWQRSIHLPQPNGP